MGIIDWLAFVFGVLGVIFTVKQSIWCWPLAIVSIVFSGYAFYSTKLFGDFFLQLIYLIQSFYGWIFWYKRKNGVFEIKIVDTKKIIFFICSVIILFAFIYPILVYLKSDKIIFDSILTAASLACTYLMINKYLQNWLIWVAIDIAYVALYGIKQMWLFAVLYLIFAALAVMGYFEWRKILKK